MEKPYDLKDLGQKIAAKAKENGLHIAEEAVEALAAAAYNGTKEWLAESAKLTSTPVDDVAVSFISYADAYVNAQIAKIDLDGSGS